MWWAWPGIFDRFESDLKVISDPGQGGTYFLSHQFSLVDAGQNQATGGYIGLQTDLLGQGKGVMFSIWDATVATPGAGATCQPFGGEGVGMQCFTLFNWVAGKTYRLRVVRDAGNNYGGYIVDTSTNAETYVGQILAPAPAVGFGGSSVQWAEYYGLPAGNCAEFRYVKALWSRPIGNSGAVMPTYTGPAYSNGYCRNSAVIASGNDGYMEEGNPGTSTIQHLKANTGKYVYPTSTSEGCGGAGLRTDAVALGGCSPITRVLLPSGKVALQTENGYYLSCTGGGGTTVTANAKTVGNNETFTETVSAGLASYKSFNGRYLTNASGVLKCSALFALTTEKFTPVINKARTATASASSESTATGQTSSKAIDGVADGYPGNASREWSSNGQGAGAWIQLNWPAATAVKQIRLFDRPNLNDQAIAGTLLFSDGSSLAVGSLPNDGSAYSVSFTSKTVTWVKFRIDQVSGTTANIGLAEFEVY